VTFATGPDDPIREVETELRGLLPAAPRIDRDRLLFEAGRRAGGRAARPWQGVSAALLLILGAGGAAAVLSSATPRTGGAVPTPVLAEAPAPAQDPVPPEPARVRPDWLAPHGSYVQVRDIVLELGVEAIPRPAHGPAEPIPAFGRSSS